MEIYDTMIFRLYNVNLLFYKWTLKYSGRQYINRGVKIMI